MLVIFDNDGVLVNSEALVKQAQAEALAAAGFPEMTYERLVAETVGHSWQRIMRQIEAETGRTPDDNAHAASRLIYKEKAKASLKPISGVAATLTALRAANIPYCVASTGAPEKIRFSLTCAGLIEHFDDSHLFSVTMVKRGKPAPDVYLYAATQMGHDPADCIVIEDATAGIEGAKRAHMQVLGFAGGDHAHNATYRAMLSAAKPTAMLGSSMLDVLPHLGLSAQAA